MATFFILLLVLCGIGASKAECTQEPGVPSHGAVTAGSTSAGSVRTYSCNSGYTLLGCTTTVCTTNGTWLPSPPMCLSGACLLLEQKGVKPYAVDNTYKYTPLHHVAQHSLPKNNLEAVSSKNEEVVAALLRCYEEDGRLHEMVTATTRYRSTALCLAAAHGSVATVRLLLQAGSDLEHRCFAGRTPLLDAAQSNDVGVVKVLVEAGANTSSDDGGNHDVLWYAKMNRDYGTSRPEVLAYLQTSVCRGTLWCSEGRSGVPPSYAYYEFNSNN